MKDRLKVQYMDFNKSKTSEPGKVEGAISQPKRSNPVIASFQPGMNNPAPEQIGLSGFMSVPLEGPVGEEILFSSEMPRAVHWSVAWADVMMTMFVIFAALYIFKTPVTETKVALKEAVTEYKENTPRDTGDRQSQEKQSIQDIYNLSRQTLSSVTSVELVPDKAVRIILKSDLLFDLGKAYIKEDAKASLREIAQVLRKTDYMVNVVGHTDDLPINTREFPSNWELSTARACQVARFLMEDMKIPEEKFYVTGHAYYQPVKPNTDDANRAANRRVEVIITKERPYGVSQTVQ